jgi:RNA polymerase sigma factor (sigma-70 family)
MSDPAPAPSGAGLETGERANAPVPIVLAMKLEEPAQPTLRAIAATLPALFEIEESALLSFAVGLVGRRTVAEELVQDAFLRLHEVWGQVDNTRAWLYRSVRNMALNHLRDHRRETPLEAAGDPAAEGRPDEELGRMEAIGMVRLLRAEMPPEDRDLITMKYHEDLKYGEISKRTGLGVGNVGYRLHHLLKGLADALRHAGIEGSRG